MDKRLLEKSLELEQGSFLYLSGGRVFVLLGLDADFKGAKETREVLSKKKCITEKDAAKLLRRQRFICLYVCEIELIDEKPLPIKSMYSYLEEVLTYRLKNNLVKVDSVYYNDLFEYKVYKPLGVKCSTEPLNLWLLKYNLVSNEKLNIQPDVNYIEKQIQYNCQISPKILNAVRFLGNYKPVDIAEIKEGEIYFTINKSQTKIAAFLYLGDKWLYLGGVILSMYGIEKVSNDFLNDEEHKKKGTIRKELNLTKVGLYRNNEVF